MKKKVVIISTEVNMTGANQSLFDWLIEADREIYNFIIVFPKYNENIWNKCKELNCEPINGMYFHEYRRLDRENMKNLITWGSNHLWMPIVVKRLKRKLAKENVVLIHSNTYASLLGAYLANELNVPHIWHIREFMEEDYQLSHFRNNKINYFHNQAYPIYISKIIKEKYWKRFERGKLVYDQVVFDKYYHHKNKKKSEPYKILMAGTLAENKGQMDAIKATELLVKEGYKVELFICGDGPDKQKILNYISTHNLSEYIYMLGFVDDLEKLRSEIDIAYVCSKMEALGRVTVENMYYENLTIGADCGCTKELISNGRGVSYPFGDFSALASATMQAIDNWDNMIEIMHNAREYAIANFSEPIYKQIYKIYNEVLSK